MSNGRLFYITFQRHRGGRGQHSSQGFFPSKSEEKGCFCTKQERLLLSTKVEFLVHIEVRGGGCGQKVCSLFSFLFSMARDSEGGFGHMEHVVMGKQQEGQGRFSNLLLSMDLVCAVSKIKKTYNTNLKETMSFEILQVVGFFVLFRCL